MVTVAPSSSAAAIPCGVVDSISEGNSLSNLLFRQFVVDPDDVGTPLATIPSDHVAAASFGAAGDGLVDDTNALQTALNHGRLVWLERNKIYRITRALTLSSGMALRSDGSASLLLAKGSDGFNNQDHQIGSIFGSRGTGIIVDGDKASLEDIYIVKEWEDNRYVIGVAVMEADSVTLNRLKLRGFSLAPGIISIYKSDRTIVANSLVHASCSMSTAVPPKGERGTFQITGITVDEGLKDDSSTSTNLRNNVILDLFMKGSFRGDQTDGINFAGTNGINSGSEIKYNYIDRVGEAIDIFGGDLSIEGNTLLGRALAIKLIHGAHNLSIMGNYIGGKLNEAGVAAYTTPADGYEPAPVRNISIESNIIDTTRTAKSGIFIDSQGQFKPKDIMINGNRFLVDACKNQAVICDSSSQCTYGNNYKLHEGVFDCNP
jgi:hypothetical protein